ncbi:hypothetical protein GIB67_025493 [Kingdonia uniflora]|uniref:Uncharacterized protein n=1 Tax=Kingdonia uniflora TaxID=39325 RepID=A0A7J7PCL8_9MAGN|nr:hypothetical protein GIB67_025493 [Kingdonia uniflora]
MALPTSGTTVSGEVAQGKRIRVEPLGALGEKVSEVAYLVKGIWLDIEKQESELKKAKSELEKNLAQAMVEAKANLGGTAEERDRLGRHLMLKGYSQEEADAIKDDTYVKVDEEEAEVLGVVDGLDGVSPQTVLDNQGDDVELPEGGREKGNVQKGNANLRECQQKLDTALIRVIILVGEFRAKDLQVKKKDELLMDLPTWEELNT